MLHRYFSCKPIMMALLLFALTCGCAGHVMVAASKPPDSLQTLSRMIQETDRIIATAQIDLMTVQGHYPVRAALILQKPSYFRMEMLPVIGTPDFFLTSKPDDLRVYIPSRNEFYSGKPSAENLGRFLSWAMNVEDMVMIFSGAHPLLTGENLSYESYAEGHLLRVEMKTSSCSQVIWIGQDGKIVKLVRNGSDGRETYSVQYEDYEPGSPLAGKITVKMADDVTSISVRFTDVKKEKATDLSIFELPVPAGIKTIHLD